jgi:two-component system alkaline phosphatase synthesis response regulator PhoP
MNKQLAIYIENNLRRQMCMCKIMSHLGLELHIVSNVSEAKNILMSCHPSFILMHMDVIGTDAFSLCSFIRSYFAYVILIVLMKRARASIEERLFDCGVSDVVAGEQTVPRVFIKRIQAHIQRNKLQWSASRVALDNVVIDFNRREIHRDGTVHRLPGILGDLLKYFVENNDRIITREELMKSNIWSDSICTPPDEGGKTFDVHISKLRKIIESDPHMPKIITSVRGIGWKLSVEVIKELVPNPAQPLVLPK